MQLHVQQLLSVVFLRVFVTSRLFTVVYVERGRIDRLGRWIIEWTFCARVVYEEHCTRLVDSESFRDFPYFRRIRKLEPGGLKCTRCEFYHTCCNVRISDVSTRTRDFIGRWNTWRINTLNRWNNAMQHDNSTVAMTNVGRHFELRRRWNDMHDKYWHAANTYTAKIYSSYLRINHAKCTLAFQRRESRRLPLCIIIIRKRAGN